ncbi:MAG: bifunctional diguanylate cyclase/phosphodiesterase [Pseudolabrys sp.]|nr:bifunctional diguanylate cyclase/phosphodiesterase [Pseudolabrys sp.]
MRGEAVSKKARSAPGRGWLALANGAGAGQKHAQDGVSRAKARRKFSASRLIVLLALLAVGTTVISAGVGYGMARQSDENLWSDQRTALRNAVGEFRNLFGQNRQVDPRFVRMVEHSARLQDLKFETEPSASDRESQPVLDAQGRIAGFFTWEKTRPMGAAMDRLMPYISGLAIALIGFAGFSLAQLRRTRRELTLSEEQARRAADEDKLTGLPNHAKTLELLDLYLAEHAAHETTTFALIELDGMEDVTSHLGVLGSDELIVAVADRLREAIPAEAVIGRVGSDRFALMLIAEDEIDVEPMIRTVLENIARPHWFESVVRVSAHAGFAQAPRHATTRGELTRRAELALRAAAKKGPGAIVGFEAAIDTVTTDQKFIQRELPRALSANELELHYQPIIAAHGGRIVGVEALLRWTHPQRGAIGPAVFIPVAEQMGLMDTLGAFVLRRALQEAKRWPDLYIAVNLSPLQVRDHTIVDVVRSALEESGVPPSRLMLEITEGVLIDNPEEMVRRIEDLHALGVRVALDDFGSGYSNLSYLQRFPLDKLKIDRSFVVALGTSANGGVIIQAIVALGRALGLSVLVEGVETEQQRVLLRLAGCDEMQGFLFAKPAPAATIDRLLSQQKQNAGSKGISAPPATLTA